MTPSVQPSNSYLLSTHLHWRLKIEQQTREPWSLSLEDKTQEWTKTELQAVNWANSPHEKKIKVVASDLKVLPSRDEGTGQFRQQCKHFTVKESVSKRKTQLEAKWHIHPVSKACLQGMWPTMRKIMGVRQAQLHWRTGHQSCTGFFFQPSAPTQAWAVADTFYNGWSSAQGVTSCCIVLLLLLS